MYTIVVLIYFKVMQNLQITKFRQSLLYTFQAVAANLYYGRCVQIRILYLYILKHIITIYSFIFIFISTSMKTEKDFQNKGKTLNLPQTYYPDINIKNFTEENQPIQNKQLSQTKLSHDSCNKIQFQKQTDKQLQFAIKKSIIRGDKINHQHDILPAFNQLTDSQQQYQNQIAINQAYYLFNEGLTFLAERNLKQAQQRLKNAIQKNPNFADAYNYYGVCLKSQGLYKQADEQYEAAIKIDQKCAQAYYNYGISLQIQDEYQKANEKYRIYLQMNGKDVDALNNYGISLKAQGKYKQADKQFMRAIQIQPEYFITYNNFGISLKAQGRYEQADRNYLIAIKLNDKYENAYYNYGISLQEQNKYEYANIQYQKVIALNPQNKNVYYNYANCLQALGKHQKAIQHYLVAIKKSPNNPNTYYNFANSLQALKDYKNAEKQYLQAIRLNPNNANFYHNYAMSLQSQGQFQSARKQYQNALQVDSSDILILTNLGNICIKLNKIEEASNYFQNAKKQLYKFEGIEYLNSKQMSLRHIQFIKQSLNLFDASHKRFQSLRRQNNEKRQTLKIIDQSQGKANEIIFNLIGNFKFQSETFVQLKNIQNNQIQIKKHIVYTKQELDCVFKQLKQDIENIAKQNKKIILQHNKIKEQLDSLKTDNQKIKQKVQKIQEHMLTKNQIQNISKILQQLKQKGQNNKKITQLLEKQLQKIGFKLEDFQKSWFPLELLQNRICQLKKNKKQKTARYAETFYWTLSTHINSYKLLKPLKGQIQVPQGEMTGFINSLSNLLEFAKPLPILGGCCQYLNYFTTKYLEQSQSIIINEIACQFSQFWNQRKISQAVSEVVLQIVSNNAYIEYIESLSLNNEIQSVFQIFKQKKQKIIKSIEGIKWQQKHIEQVLAITDCSYIITSIFEMNQQVKSYKQMNKDKNFMILIATELLQERKEQIAMKQQKQLVQINNKIGQQTCEIF